MRALLLLLCLLTTPAWASLDMSGFSRLPIQHDGRVKPLDTFARVQLRLLYGADALPDMTASQWLALTLFAPMTAADKPVFRLQHDSLIALLEVPPREPPIYSFLELRAGIEKTAPAVPELIKNAENLSEPQRALLMLHDAVQGFLQISYTLALLLPMESTVTDFGTPPPDTYLHWQRHRERLEGMARGLLARDTDTFTPEEIAVLDVWAHLRGLEEKGAQNIILRLIPPPWEGQRAWLSPWQTIILGASAPQNRTLFGLWQSAAYGYRANDDATWNTAITALAEATVAQAGMTSEAWRLGWEVTMQRLPPLDAAAGLYALTLLLWLVSRYRALSQAAMLAPLLAATLLHTLALVLRVVILERPPVSTLYESLLFVSLITAVIGLFMLWRERQPAGSFIGAGSALFILLASQAFAGHGDTKDVLIAVLDSHFWLIVHVLVITIGYAFCIVTSLQAHYALATGYTERLASLRKLALLSLLFTTVGTILGGIWADQSWGRFWGWDPKENGALLIILWIVWLLHGRIAGQVGALWFTAGLACLSIIIALSWIGVNLLGVGLHSYGFTDAAAWGLLAFCLTELVLIAGLTLHAAHQQRCHAPATPV